MNDVLKIARALELWSNMRVIIILPCSVQLQKILHSGWAEGAIEVGVQLNLDGKSMMTNLVTH